MSNSSKLSPAQQALAAELSALMDADKLVRHLVCDALKAFKRQQSMRHEFGRLTAIPTFAYVFGALASQKLPGSSVLDRIPVDEYAMFLAVAAAARSQDPHRKVGASALNADNRCIATSYNGLVAGKEFDFIWWESDENRRTRVVHAEANLVSLTARNEAATVAVTLLPCGPCALALAAHGVKTILYGREYKHDQLAKEILADFGVSLRFVPAQAVAENLQGVLPFII
jgi:dCMP deaminase